MNYETELVEVSEIGDFVKLCNKEGYKIISTSYITDSQQMLVIVEKASVVKRNFFDKQEKDGVESGE